MYSLQIVVHVSFLLKARSQTDRQTDSETDREGERESAGSGAVRAGGPLGPSCPVEEEERETQARGTSIILASHARDVNASLTQAVAQRGTRLGFRAGGPLVWKGTRLRSESHSFHPNSPAAFPI